MPCGDRSKGGKKRPPKKNKGGKRKGGLKGKRKAKK